jgi:hypothetical protein
MASERIMDREKIVLDIATMLYCCECLELRARQQGGANRTIIGKPLEQIAADWRSLIDECATP